MKQGASPSKIDSLQWAIQESPIGISEQDMPENHQQMILSDAMKEVTDTDQGHVIMNWIIWMITIPF